MAKVEPNDFLLNSDYEMDKIVLFKEGSLTASITIEHGLLFTPLVFGVWSNNSDFSSSNPLGWADTALEPGYTPIESVECYANATNIVLNPAGNNGGTIYYRIYAFEPTNTNNAAPTTSNHAQDFILNTDYNYRKLCRADYFTESNEEYEHNLSYIPQVMTWMEYSWDDEEFRIQPLVFYSDFTNVGAKITSSKLKAGDFLGGVIKKIHWRIYYDKA